LLVFEEAEDSEANRVYKTSIPFPQQGKDASVFPQWEVVMNWRPGSGALL